MTTRIPQVVLDAYVARWSHLGILAGKVNDPAVTGLRAARTFAQTVCCLESPPTVTINQVRGLARVANGEPWEAIPDV